MATLVRRVYPALVVLVALLAAGCQRSPAAGPPAPPGSRPRTALTGSLTVFAAASLTEAFEDDKTRLVASNAGLALTYSFAGSQQLVAQVAAGAPADVVATADHQAMDRLVAGGLVEVPVDFAANRLQIAVEPGNPKRVTSLADLGRADVRTVLADTSVPAGRYARQALDSAGVSVRPVSLDLDVKAVLLRVSSGEADAGVVYVTDVAAAGPTVAAVDIPPEHNVVATYPVAVVRTTRNRAGAEAFVAQLLDGPGRDALLAHGFRAT